MATLTHDHPSERTTVTTKKPKPAPQKPQAAPAPQEVPSFVDLLGKVGKE